MSDNKKYYYIRLKENFFESEEIVYLESLENGHKYSNILLKLYLKSLKREGELKVSDRIPYSDKMISSFCKHDIDTVSTSIKLFIELGLIDILDNGTIYILNIQNYIGVGSSEADRIRKYRSRISKERNNFLPDKTNGVQMSYKSTPEIRDYSLEIINKEKI